MPDLSNNNSFIPKRGPVNKRRPGSTSRPVYVFTIISYVLMFATLIATAGVYFYGRLIDKQLANEVAALNIEISSFSESDMQQVLEFDARLKQAKERLDNSVSVASVFDALEKATINSVQVVLLDLTREKDEQFILNATVETDSFDSTIFQRGIYQRNQTISNVAILDLQNVKNTQADATQPVSFIAKLNVPLSAVPYVVNQTPVFSAPIIITEPAIEGEAEMLEDETVPSEANNNENI